MLPQSYGCWEADFTKNPAFVPAVLRDVKSNKPSPARMKNYGFTNAVGKVARFSKNRDG
ncbi:MAG: hypothetical protein IJ037_03370 [Clostridia bacterium]|nr:hypothetical protein [Clostridia bacterium]